MSDKTTDNISVVSEDGKTFTINKRDLKPIVRSCKQGEHKLVIDPTEVSDYWQGYVCKHCNLGKLIRKI